MKRFTKFICLALVGCCMLPLGLRAQQMPPVPVDKNVRIGKLDNGLTYYIRHNDYPENQVDFYIAQKVGSIQEEENQRGLAHFLEHMCFNGTKHFPGNTLIPWLESVGVKFGMNLNAYTAVDETVYRICGVPSERIGVQDSCLLILSDWANGLLLEDKAIDEERAVIHEEWRSQMPPMQRIFEKTSPVIFPDSRYGSRSPIGLMSVVDHFPYQALRDYYEKWYRPDLQGVVVVGDVDVDRIEAKIKELFAPIELPAQPAERVYYPVDDFTEPVIAIGQDKEQGNSLVKFYFKYDVLPDSLRNTMLALTTEYMLDMADMMMMYRLHDISTKPDAPYALAQGQHGDMELCKTKKAMAYIAVPKGSDTEPAMDAVYREVLRAKRGGFTATEYARCRSEYLSQLEQAYNNRNHQENRKLAESYVRNFLDKTPIPGIENEYQLMNMLANQIPVEAVNQMYAQLLNERNMAVLIALPEKDGVVCPDAAALKASLAQIDAEEIAPYVDNVKNEPLISQLPAAGKVVSEKALPQFGAKEWMLSNGVKVIVKKTDFKNDEIVFRATAKGGTSVYGDELVNDLLFMPVVAAQHGLGEFTFADLAKQMAGKQAVVNIELDHYVRNVSGNATPKDLKTLMELIYLNFTQLNVTAAEFTALQNLLKGVLQNQESNPQLIFQQKLNQFMYQSPRMQMLDAADVDGANREHILKIIREQLANASQFTFVFSGNFDEAELKSLAEQYLASLPSDPTQKAEIKRISGIGVTAGEKTEEVKLKMEVPQAYGGIFVSGTVPYNFKNRILASMCAQLMSARLLSEVREKEGATYSIATSGVLERTSDVPLVYQTVFPMKPEKKDRALEIIRNEFTKLAQQVDEAELAKVKEFMVKQFAEMERTNSYWCGEIAGNELLPSELPADTKAVIEAIGATDICSFMKELEAQQNYRVFVVMPM